MIRRPPRSTHCISSAASDVYKRQILYFAIGTTYLSLEKYHEAEAYINKAISVYAKQKQPDHILLAYCHSDLGTALVNLRRYNEAITSFETALEIYLSKPQGNEEIIAELKENLNELYRLALA
eukprot:TRINITY_DN6876_c0_g2_i15.p1 TRINITY_DN6876_c0_g2~~TRINITY_DN6876_c0_g2_i15.p1  ORF type:complete len:134 (-),score=17.49 TRINITY_DN6876_c0_g2_i15:48-416(-)